MIWLFGLIYFCKHKQEDVIMKKHILIQAIAAGLMTIGGGSAVAASALSVPGYFGSINNDSGYVMECSQVIGGYCANNPMPANGYIQMLPDPGSHMIRGHLMFFNKNVPGAYVDNVLFIYQEKNKNQWEFTTKSQYSKVKIAQLLPDTLLVTSSAKSTH